MTSLESGSELENLVEGNGGSRVRLGRGKKKEMGRLGREAAKAQGGRGH